MNAIKMLNEGANIQFVISASELKEALTSWYAEIRRAEKAQEEERYLTIQEVSDLLKVNRSTLWKWNKSGYLTAIKTGSKPRYKLSDVKKIMEG